MERLSVIFDLDGTLIDSRQDLADSVNLTRAQHHLSPLERAEIMTYIGDGARQLLERAFHDAPQFISDALITQFRANYRAHLTDFTRLYPGVTETIQLLHHQGVKMALFSNKPEDACYALMDYFLLTPFLSPIIGGGGAYPLKPEPDAILAICREHVTSPQNVFMVGDHFTDLAAAQRAGIRTVFCRFGIGQTRGYTPEFEIEAFTDLPNVLYSAVSAQC